MLRSRVRAFRGGGGARGLFHVDLHPGNVLVSGAGDRARLSGVLDVGGLGSADPALDLVAAWHLLADGPRQAFQGDQPAAVHGGRPYTLDR